MIFKILSTIAVGLFTFVWSFRNLRWINDFLVSKTGIGETTADRIARRKARQEKKEETPTANT